MNKLIYVLMVFLIHLSAFGQEVGSQRWVENEARKLQNMRISLVTREQVDKLHDQLIIEELRNRSQWPLLIRLRDEVTITQIVSRYFELEGKSKFLRLRMADSRSPWLLPLLAPILDEDPTIAWRNYGEQGEDFGYPHTTADLMRQILHNSPEFTEEVRESFIDKGEDPWLLAGMRRWWAENADSITTENYSEVSEFDHSDLMKINFMSLYGLVQPSPTNGSPMEPTNKVESITTPTSKLNNSSSNNTIGVVSAASDSSRLSLILVISGCLIGISVLSYIFIRKKNLNS